MLRTPGQGVSPQEREFMAAFGIQPGEPVEQGLRKALDEHEAVVDGLAQARKHLIEGTAITQEFADRIEGLVLRARLRARG